MTRKLLNNVMILLVTIIGFISFTTVTVNAAGTESTVSTQYSLFDDLSQEEQQSIVKEQPNVAILHDTENFKLVYKEKQTEASPAVPTVVEKIDTPINSSTTKAKTENKTETSLPKAGEAKTTFLLGITGAVIVLLTMGLFVWKRKQLKTMFVLLLLAGGFGGTVTANAVTQGLPEPTSQLMIKGEAIYSVNTNLENYDYIGYIHTFSDTTPRIQTGTIHVKYQDIHGDPIVDDVLLTGNVGDSYTAEQKVMADYALKKVDGNPSGTYTQEPQTVIFVYEKEWKFVTGKYQDTEGNTISDDTVLSGYVGNLYAVEQKTIDGYTLKEIQGDAESTFSNEDKVVILIYSKQVETGTITLKRSGFIDATNRGYIHPNFYKVTYYDIDNNVIKQEEIHQDTILEDEVIRMEIGSSYTVYERATIECYSVETGERLVWGDYVLFTNEYELTKGTLTQPNITIEYLLYNISFA